MNLCLRLAPLLLATAFALPAAVSAASAADTGAQGGPHRRAADPVLVRGLQNHVWTLQSATEANGQPIDGLVLPAHPFVMRFDGARLSVKGGCNTMFGSWRLSPQGQLMPGRLASTMMACDAALTKADQALAAVLAQPLAVQLEGGAAPMLRLQSPTQQLLVLRGEATLESRYGAPKRMFLEVAPQTVPCQPGAGAPAQCLQVRERRFDKQGLRIEPPGEWRAFHGEIQGYTHTPGTRNVLRINRYTRSQPPADASRYVYVLDLVVESETVKQ
jgi:heat shock protein HslJ